MGAQSSGSNSQRPTLADLSRMLGVSKATVSYALNGRPGVSDDTRKRVLDAAATLGYSGRGRQPAMAANGHKAVAAVLSSTESDGSPNYYVTELLVGAEKACREAGYSVIVSTGAGMDARSVLASANVSGLLYLGGSFDLRSIGSSDIPTVLIGAASPSWSCDSVLADNRRGAYMATSHLISLGRRKVAFINGPETTTTSRSKMSGFLDALADGGIDPSTCPTASGDFSMQSGYGLTMGMFQDESERPDALFVADDPMGLGALHALAELGLEVPSDVAVIAFGNSSAGRVSRPALSTVGVFQEDLGRIGAKLLLRRIDGDPSPQQRILVCPQLILRGSSQAVAAETTAPDRLAEEFDYGQTK